MYMCVGKATNVHSMRFVLILHMVVAKKHSRLHHYCIQIITFHDTNDVHTFRPMIDIWSSHTTPFSFLVKFATFSLRCLIIAYLEAIGQMSGDAHSQMLQDPTHIVDQDIYV